MIEWLAEAVYENNPFLIMAAGLTIGILHAFEPDHISSASTQLLGKDASCGVGNTRLGIGFVTKGILWGAGHTFSIALIGLLVVGLSLHISDAFFTGAEFVAGFMLIGLGVLTVTNRRMFGQRHIHPHRHSDGTVHTHGHDHGKEHGHGHKFYLIGCIHGLAGSGGLVALAASSMSGIDTMLYFLAVFGAGSIIGMTIASGAIGLPLAMLPKIGMAARYVRYAVSGVALAAGISIVFGLSQSL